METATYSAMAEQTHQAQEKQECQRVQPRWRWRHCQCITGILVVSGIIAAPVAMQTLLQPVAPELYDEVVLPSGRVRGLRVHIEGETSERFGRQFLGIPYGKAGRWEMPQPADLGGDLDATNFRASCVRPESFHLDETLSEDCLHLNIYTPLQVTGELTLVSPVLVWFHGGSFTVGAGSDTHREQVRELVLTHRLVVVTINYRLGVFGFLGSRKLQAFGPNGSHEHVPTTGNFGILDQQLALKWVKRYIRYFGGDPHRVNIVGWSAGAASVSAHLTMPSSRGLFSGAIMMSGGFADWGAQSMEDAEASYEALLEAVGCGASDRCHEPGEPCSCLTALSASTLVDAETRADVFWAPTVDGSFLPWFPTDALQMGLVHKGVPIIIGSTVEDTTVDIGPEATLHNLREYLATLVVEPSVAVGYQLYANESRSKNRQHAKGYSAAFWAARRASSDMEMTCVARRVARMWRSAGGADAWWYVWEQDSLPLWVSGGRRLRGLRHERSSGDGLRLGSCWPCPGAGHGADLPYLFEQPELNVEDSAGDLADIYQSFFADFISRGDPNSWYGFTLSRDGRPAWPLASHGGMSFAAQGTAGSNDLRSAFCDYWDAQELSQ